MDLGNAFNSPVGRDIAIGSYIGTLISAAIVIAGVIMVILFVAGGLMMIASAGSGDSQGAAKGRQAITWALVGFVIVFTSYWIIRIIEIITGTTFLTNPNIFN